MRWSAKVVVVQWIRMQVLSMEVPGSNSSKFVFVLVFFQHFLHTLVYPAVTALLEYLDPAILHLLGFYFVTFSL